MAPGFLLKLLRVCFGLSGSYLLLKSSISSARTFSDHQSLPVAPVILLLTVVALLFLD